MLLRRFVEHIKNENWFAVLLDFIVVVFGIFIALQVTEWKDKNNVKQQTIELLKQAKIEAASNNERLVKYIDSSLKREQIFIANMENLIRCDEKSDNQEVFDEMLTHFLFNFTVNINNTALQQLYSPSSYPLYENRFISQLNEFTNTSLKYIADTKANASIAWNNWSFNKPPYVVKNNPTNSQFYFSNFSYAANFHEVCENQQSIRDIHSQQLIRAANYDMYKDIKKLNDDFISEIDKQIKLIN